MYISSPWLQNKENLSLQVYDSHNQRWTDLIEPQAMEWSVYDLDAGGSTGRDLTGKMLRDRVSVKEKLTISWGPMVAEDFTQMLELVADQFFECRYYSIKTGGYRQATMYVGDRSAKWYGNVKGNSSDIVTDVKFNFIER